jgi:hypothetical protein
VCHKTDSLTAVCSLQVEFPDDGGAGHHRNMSEYLGSLSVWCVMLEICRRKNQSVSLSVSCSSSAAAETSV